MSEPSQRNFEDRKDFEEQLQHMERKALRRTLASVVLLVVTGFALFAYTFRQAKEAQDERFWHAVEVRGYEKKIQDLQATIANYEKMFSTPSPELHRKNDKTKRPNNGLNNEGEQDSTTVATSFKTRQCGTQAQYSIEDKMHLLRPSFTALGKKVCGLILPAFHDADVTINFMMKFEIQEDGSVAGASIGTSSGSQDFDAAAEKVVNEYKFPRQKSPSEVTFTMSYPAKTGAQYD
jgi:TonB family protein